MSTPFIPKFARTRHLRRELVGKELVRSLIDGDLTKHFGVILLTGAGLLTTVDPRRSDSPW